MANAEQLSILKREVKAWNGWRAKNIYVYADLREADLNGVDLSSADLRIAHLRRANLFRANLRGADLSGADLSDADLREANLSEANLTKANLNGANLSRAFAKEANLSGANLLAANLRNANFGNANIAGGNLTVANLEGADLDGAILSRTNLTKAYLSGASLRRADLSGARLARSNLSRSDLGEVRFIDTEFLATDLSEATLGFTVFVNSDLSGTTGLESIRHCAPSHISMDTFILAKGKIPGSFLRGCGLNDADIEYAKLSNPDLSKDEVSRILSRIHTLRAAQASQSSPLFISCSQANSHFVDKLSKKLDEKGIRYWPDVHEVKVERMEKQTDRSLHKTPRVLLILSAQSVQSDWIEREVQEATKLEKERDGSVLCPVALDNGWKSDGLSDHILEQIQGYEIFDYSAWKDVRAFNGLFDQLIDRLDLLHKG